MPYIGEVVKEEHFLKNVYIDQLKAQGKEPSKAPAPKATYPRKIGARVFHTEAEYMEALYDFMNSN